MIEDRIKDKSSEIASTNLMKSLPPDEPDAPPVLKKRSFLKGCFASLCCCCNPSEPHKFVAKQQSSNDSKTIELMKLPPKSSLMNTEHSKIESKVETERSSVSLDSTPRETIIHYSGEPAALKQDKDSSRNMEHLEMESKVGSERSSVSPDSTPRETTIQDSEENAAIKKAIQTGHRVVEALLSSERSSWALMNYSKRVSGLESTEFLVVMQGIDSHSSDRLAFIVTNFVLEGSPKEINISFALRSKIKEHYAAKNDEELSLALVEASIEVGNLQMFQGPALSNAREIVELFQ